MRGGRTGSGGEGPSSDIYILDASDDRVRRLTFEIGEVYSIDWSPSGEWIAYTAALSEYSSDTVGYIVTAAGEVVVEYPGAGNLPLEWISPTMFLSSHVASTVGVGHMVLLDASSSTGTSMWRWGFSDYAYVEPEDEIMLYSPWDLSGFPELPKPGPVSGLYAIDLASAEASLWMDDYAVSNFEYWSAGAFPYVVSAYSDGLVGITTEGECELLSPSGGYLAVSPDDRYLADYDWVAFADRRPGLRVYGLDGTILRYLSREPVDWMAWAPDSCCILFQVRPYDDGAVNVLYLANLGDGEPVLIARDVARGSFRRGMMLQAAWIQ